MNCPHMFAVNMGEVGEGIVLIEDRQRHVVGAEMEGEIVPPGS